MNAPGWLSLALSHSATSCLVTARGSARQNSGSGEDLAPSAASLTQFRSIKAAWEREGAGLEWGQRWWGLSDSGSEVGPCLGFPAVSTGMSFSCPRCSGDGSRCCWSSSTSCPSPPRARSLLQRCFEMGHPKRTPTTSFTSHQALKPLSLSQEVQYLWGGLKK